MALKPMHKWSDGRLLKKLMYYHSDTILFQKCVDEWNRRAIRRSAEQVGKYTDPVFEPVPEWDAPMVPKEYAISMDGSTPAERFDRTSMTYPGNAVVDVRNFMVGKSASGWSVVGDPMALAAASSICQEIGAGIMNTIMNASGVPKTIFFP